LLKKLVFNRSVIGRSGGAGKGLLASLGALARLTSRVETSFHEGVYVLDRGVFDHLIE
jgi:hypothetical protein